MKTSLIIVTMLSVLLLAACVTPTATPGTPTQSPASSPTQPATMPATQPPSVLPTQPPSVLPTPPPSPLTDVKPGGGLITRPQADVWKNAPAAALQARADLVNRVHVDPDTITLVSVEKVEWPDGCLGVQTPGVMCTMVVTPGYRVVLEAGGKQYEYHTNESGDVVRLASVS